jgi:hypothetical protein
MDSTFEWEDELAEMMQQWAAELPNLTAQVDIDMRLTTRSGPTLILTFGPTSLIRMPVRFGKVLAVPARMGCRGRNGV